MNSHARKIIRKSCVLSPLETDNTGWLVLVDCGWRERASESCSQRMCERERDIHYNEHKMANNYVYFWDNFRDTANAEGFEMSWTRALRISGYGFVRGITFKGVGCYGLTGMKNWSLVWSTHTRTFTREDTLGEKENPPVDGPRYRSEIFLTLREGFHKITDTGFCHYCSWPRHTAVRHELLVTMLIALGWVVQRQLRSELELKRDKTELSQLALPRDSGAADLLCKH